MNKRVRAILKEPIKFLKWCEALNLARWYEQRLVEIYQRDRPKKDKLSLMRGLVLSFEGKGIFFDFHLEPPAGSRMHIEEFDTRRHQIAERARKSLRELLRTMRCTGEQISCRGEQA